MDVFGLAFWGGELYAFTDQGSVVLVTFDGETLATTPPAGSERSARSVVPRRGLDDERAGRIGALNDTGSVIRRGRDRASSGAR